MFFTWSVCTKHPSHGCPRIPLSEVSSIFFLIYLPSFDWLVITHMFSVRSLRVVVCFHVFTAFHICLWVCSFYIWKVFPHVSCLALHFLSYFLSLIWHCLPNPNWLSPVSYSSSFPCTFDLVCFPVSSSVLCLTHMPLCWDFQVFLYDASVFWTNFDFLYFGFCPCYFFPARQDSFLFFFPGFLFSPWLDTL